MASWKRILLIGSMITFSASATPIAIRITQDEGVPSLAILFIRFVITIIPLTLYVLRRHRRAIDRLTPSDWLWSGFSGIWLAFNLLALFFALEATSVFVVGVIRRTTPIWVIVPEVVLLGAVFSWRMWSGSILAVVGVIVVTLGAAVGVGVGENPLLGALIALGGSMCFGVYLLIGRKIAPRMPSTVYSWIVFTSTMLVTLVAVILTRTPLTGYTATGYLWVAITAVLSQYLGHLFINMGLQIFSATAMAILLELSVVISGVMAFFQFGEIPGTLQIAGSAVIILGVILASTESRQKAKQRKQREQESALKEASPSPSSS